MTARYPREVFYRVYMYAAGGRYAVLVSSLKDGRATMREAKKDRQITKAQLVELSVRRTLHQETIMESKVVSKWEAK